MALIECTNSCRSTANPLHILTVASICIAFKWFIKAMRSTLDLPHPFIGALVLWDGVPPDLPHPLIRAVRVGCATNSLHYSVKIMSTTNLISVVTLCIHRLNHNHAAQMQRSALIWISSWMHTLSVCATASDTSDKTSFYRKMLCNPVDNHCCNQRPHDA